MISWGDFAGDEMTGYVPKFHVVLQILSVVQSTVRLCKKPFIIVLRISSHLSNKLEFSVLLGSSSSDVTAL